MSYYTIKKYRYEGTPTANDTNRNMLLFRDPTVDGLKTGHTDAAGYCLIATAKRDFPNVGARRLLAIVLGATSENGARQRGAEAAELGLHGLSRPSSCSTPTRPVVTPEVWKGTAEDRQAGPPPGGRGGRAGRHRRRSRPRWRGPTRWSRP